jgi:hypothetical protein
MADGFELLEAEHRKVDGRFENYLHDNDDAIAREICAALTTAVTISPTRRCPSTRPSAR